MESEEYNQLKKEIKSIQRKMNFILNNNIENDPLVERLEIRFDQIIEKLKRHYRPSRKVKHRLRLV